MRYRNHEITRTTVIHAPTGRALYAIDGQITKGATQTPFLIDMAGAKDWLEKQLEPALTNRYERKIAALESRFERGELPIDEYARMYENINEEFGVISAAQSATQLQ